MKSGTQFKVLVISSGRVHEERRNKNKRKKNKNLKKIDSLNRLLVIHNGKSNPKYDPNFIVA